MSDEDTPPMARPRVAAGALFFDDEGRVLLVKPAYKEGWDIPGGYVEPGETPIEACEREIKEELGLHRRVCRLLVVDWAPSAEEGDKVLFVFDGGQMDTEAVGRLTLPATELKTAAFHDARQLQDRMADRLWRRVEAAIQARRSDQPAYLEHGLETRADTGRA